MREQLREQGKEMEGKKKMEGRKGNKGNEEMYVWSKGKEGNSWFEVVAKEQKKRVTLCLCETERKRERSGGWRGEECPGLAQQNGMEGGVCSHCCCQTSTFPLQSHGDFLTYTSCSTLSLQEFPTLLHRYKGLIGV